MQKVHYIISKTNYFFFLSYESDLGQMVLQKTLAFVVICLDYCLDWRAGVGKQQNKEENVENDILKSLYHRHWPLCCLNCADGVNSTLTKMIFQTSNPLGCHSETISREDSVKYKTKNTVWNSLKTPHRYI